MKINNLKIVGFISNEMTLSHLKDIIKGAWYHSPKEFQGDIENNVLLLLVLHVTQPPDPRCEGILKKYECFEECIKLIGKIGEGLLIERTYTNHKAWMECNKEKIKFIVLTSGDDIDPEIVNNADELLINKGTGVSCVVGYKSSELAKILKQVLEYGNSIEEISYILRSGLVKEECILQCLSAILPFGLMWEAKGDKDKGEAVKAISEIMQGGNGPKINFEALILGRLIEHLNNEAGGEDNWLIEMNGEDKVKVRWLDDILKAAGDNVRIKEKWQEQEVNECPLSLDQALKVLASSETLDQWNARLRILRDCLLEERVVE